MYERKIEKECAEQFEHYLKEEEKSSFTIEKYLRDIRRFAEYVSGGNVSKEVVIQYKEHLIEQDYAVRSINSMLASINSFFRFMGWDDCKVKNIRVQQQIYCKEEKELTKEDYYRLLNAARQRPKLNLLMQTIAGTGIRISELAYFTVEAVEKGDVCVLCKNKNRNIFVPENLRKKLLAYAEKQGITEGIIFRTKNGNLMDRSNIWHAMKTLCRDAGVNPEKVFPHNLRKLFARTFYEMEKDIAKLADILGHGNINTTRIYIIETGKEHRRKIEQLGLVV